MNQTVQAEAMDVLVAEYVAGQLTRPASVLIDCHLELVPERQSWVRELETFAGHSLENEEEAELSNFSSMLDNIFASDGNAVDIDLCSERTVRQSDGWMPAALKEFIGLSPDELKWRMKMPGVYGHKIETEGYDVSLLKIKPGVSVPTHTHEGRELTLVLKGSFKDHVGNFKRGDISVADGDVDHKPVAGMEEECICFIVNDAPLRLTGPIGRIVTSLLPR